MGATCGCGDKEDAIHEVATDPKKLGQDKFDNVKVAAGQTEKLYTPQDRAVMPDSQTNMPLHFEGDQHMAILEA